MIFILIFEPCEMLRYRSGMVAGGKCRMVHLILAPPETVVPYRKSIARQLDDSSGIINYCLI